MQEKYFICQHCGNIVAMIRDRGVPIYCCGEVMQEILPGTTDAAHEKHVPVCQVHGNQVTVTVGEVAHPMTAEHYIEWICLQTKYASQHRKLEPNTPPTACFALCDGDAVERVYAFCNLHGLWQG